jgi:hypothetical protein
MIPAQRAFPLLLCLVLALGAFVAVLPSLPQPGIGGRSTSTHETVIHPVAGAIVSGAAASQSYRIDNPYDAPGIFRKAQLHLHTSESPDGNPTATPRLTAETFKRAGYGFTMFTDHDVATAILDLNDSTFATMTGYESTGVGHIGAWFTNKLIDPRLPAQQRIDEIRQAGGIVALNHPDYAVGFTLEELKSLTGYQVLEIYNQITTPIGRGQEYNLAANLEKWRQVLNHRGRSAPVWGIAVSDTHDATTGGGWTVVKTVAVSEAELRRAIVSGSMYATTGADFSSIEVEDGAIVATTGPGTLIKFINQAGTVRHEGLAESARFLPGEHDEWVRIELIDYRGNRAWSQPLWIIRGQTDQHLVWGD